MLKPALTALALGLALAGPAATLDGPEDLVAMIYHGLNVQDSAAEANRALSRDVAAAYIPLLGGQEPADVTDFDWRTGAQDYELTDLQIGLAVDLPSVGGVTMADVTVTFHNFNQPQTVTWTLCLGRKGWRVADVRGKDTDGEWRLREMLKLPADKVRC